MIHTLQKRPEGGYELHSKACSHLKENAGSVLFQNERNYGGGDIECKGQLHVKHEARLFSYQGSEASYSELSSVKEMSIRDLKVLSGCLHVRVHSGNIDSLKVVGSALLTGDCIIHSSYLCGRVNLCNCEVHDTIIQGDVHLFNAHIRSPKDLVQITESRTYPPETISVYRSKGGRPWCSIGFFSCSVTQFVRLTEADPDRSRRKHVFLALEYAKKKMGARFKLPKVN